ncbi:hypothetical protein Tco_0978796 [Tanacetum coccineum]|uniref:Uncharacterized protein n=1 Tax=Tanacetum coccineum TaxID=301880 RepID=A0ABQ5ENV6_9ASTR
MLAPRSAKALHEKVLLKVHEIRKLPGSPSLGGTLFWIMAELSSLRKADEICSSLCLLLTSSLRNLPYSGIIAKTSTRGVDSSSSSSLSNLTRASVRVSFSCWENARISLRSRSNKIEGKESDNKSGMVIVEPGVRATTRSAAHMGSSSTGL